jgi:MATE family multidrug resistance protein
LGAGRPQAARVAISVGMLLTISQACITSFLYLWLRGVLGHAFSSDIDVIKNVSMLINLVSISSFLDSTQAVLSGVTLKTAFIIFSSMYCTRWSQCAFVRKTKS